MDPIDEPLLANVFSENQFTTISGYFGQKEVMLPYPEVLVSMKINSVLNRNKEDKRIKDVADIYSLMWYSDTKFQDLKQNVQKICGSEKVSSIVQFVEADYSAASQALGIDSDEISRVIVELARK